MIFASERRATTRAARDRMVPVPANIKESTHKLVLPPHNHHRDAGYFAREEVARVLDSTGGADIVPRAPENRLSLAFENLGARIPVRGQRTIAVHKIRNRLIRR